jgi:hypothetical protein
VKVRFSAGHKGTPIPVPTPEASGPPAGSAVAPEALRWADRARMPPGWRAPALAMSAGYPEKSFYGLPPAQLAGLVAAELLRNPRLAAATAPAGKLVWDPAAKRHVRAPAGADGAGGSLRPPQGGAASAPEPLPRARPPTGSLPVPQGRP